MLSITSEQDNDTNATITTTTTTTTTIKHNDNKASLVQKKADPMPETSFQGKECDIIVYK